MTQSLKTPLAIARIMFYLALLLVFPPANDDAIGLSGGRDRAFLLRPGDVSHRHGADVDIELHGHPDRHGGGEKQESSPRRVVMQGLSFIGGLAQGSVMAVIHVQQPPSGWGRLSPVFEVNQAPLECRLTLLPALG
ncbi:hypothetical protein [Aeromonas sp. NJAU223]|uniref:hypothetical protein n=1 Tax=Aeromonas sp. NJAU223 TaxID=3115650 RepID=UPI003DA8A02B